MYQLGDWVVPLIEDPYKEIYVIRMVMDFYEDGVDHYCCQDGWGYPADMLRSATNEEIERYKRLSKEIKEMLSYPSHLYLK